jgi:phosphoglycolate phosphatase
LLIGHVCRHTGLARHAEVLETALLAQEIIAPGDGPANPAIDFLAALDALDDMGVRYAVVTNKRENLARPLLDALDLTPRLATIIGGDTLDVAKPDPLTIRTMIKQCGGDPLRDAARTAFIGDSHFDIDAGRAADTATVACSFGFMMQPVETLGAHAVIDHFDELIPTLRRLG